MSLGIVFKGPEGMVLAADSRVTLTFQQPPIGNPMLPPSATVLLHSTFDNATKLLKVKGQDYVGAVTYGMGAIGLAAPRTAHSFIPEFEAELSTQGRLPVADFAQRLSDFFMRQWTIHMQGYIGQDYMVFLVGGFDPDAPYGRVFEINIPFQPQPHEWYENTFGPVWGGQREFTDRLLNGFDPRLADLLTNTLSLDGNQRTQMENALRQLSVPIPYQFLPLQDCVDLSIMLIRTTRSIQTFYVGVRGVGGAIDVATSLARMAFNPYKGRKLRASHS